MSKYNIVGNLMHWLISVTIDTSNIVPAVSDDSDTPVINCIGKTSRVYYFFSKGHMPIKRLRIVWTQKVSEYDQEIPQTHTADQPTAPLGRATEH